MHYLGQVYCEGDFAQKEGVSCIVTVDVNSTGWSKLVDVAGGAMQCI